MKRRREEEVGADDPYATPRITSKKTVAPETQRSSKKAPVAGKRYLFI